MATENLTAKKALERARAEVLQENEEKAVAKFKAKLRELESARAIVRNLEREIEELEHEIGNL